MKDSAKILMLLIIEIGIKLFTNNKQKPAGRHLLCSHCNIVIFCVCCSFQKSPLHGQSTDDVIDSAFKEIDKVYEQVYLYKGRVYISIIWAYERSCDGSHDLSCDRKKIHRSLWLLGNRFVTRKFCIVLIL